MINVYARYHNTIFMDLISSDSKVPERSSRFATPLAKLTNNHNGLMTKLT